ncbi:MAG: helix-turn-helix domain-containing protein [Azospirillaceae bacterium]
MTEEERSGRSPVARSITRAGAILRALEDGPLRASALAERLAIPRSSLHEVVAMMIEAGLVETDGRGRVAPGALVGAAGRAAAGMPPVPGIEKTLEALAVATGGTAYLAVLDEGDVLVVAARGQPPGRVGQALAGRRLPALTSTHGRVLLAGLDARARRYFATAHAAPGGPPLADALGEIAVVEGRDLLVAKGEPEPHLCAALRVLTGAADGRRALLGVAVTSEDLLHAKDALEAVQPED